jgi:hypothetical protein
LFRSAKTLDMVDVGVGGDQRHALGKGKIELADNLQALIDRIFIADVDESPIVVVVVDQINAATDPAASLVVQLNDVREQGLTFENCHQGRGWLAGVLLADRSNPSADPTGTSDDVQPDAIAKLFCLRIYRGRHGLKSRRAQNGCESRTVIRIH